MLSALLQSSLAGVQMEAAAQFTAGYLYGITSIDKRDYIVGTDKIVGCFKEDADLNNIIDTAIADQKKGDNEAAQKEWQKTTKLYETAMAKCKDVAGDFEDLKKFEDGVLARKDAKEFIEANMKKYKAEIEKAETNKIGEWEKGVYFNSGMFAGYSMQYMGLAPPREQPTPPSPQPDPKPDRSSKAPAQFISGWMYGVDGKDERDYILGCYKADDDLTNNLYDAMEAYEAGDQKTGDSKMNDTKKGYETALNKCDKISADMKTIADKADALVKREDWDKIAKKIYDDNKVLIDRDVDLELREWKQGVWFNSGMFAGYVEKTFLDNAPAEPAVSSPYALFAPF